MIPSTPQRTVFIDNGTGQHIYSGTLAFSNTLWYTVRLLPGEICYTDEELVNLTIQRLRTGLFNVEVTPMRQMNGLHIAYPVTAHSNATHLEVALNQAQGRREEILRGMTSIDRVFVFGERVSGEMTRYIYL